MLSYIFWHRPKGASNQSGYEELLLRFQWHLNQQKLRGLLETGSFRVSPLPWLKGERVYEDWCLVEGSWVLDALNALAVEKDVAGAHDAAAAQMDEGHGGLYSLVWGEAALPSRSTAVWLTRPRGIQWRPILDALRDEFPKATLWRRHMVLGPGKEFALIMPPDQKVTVPSEWTAFFVDRDRVGLRGGQAT
jgi:hypothetical protein